MLSNLGSVSYDTLPPKHVHTERTARSGNMVFLWYGYAPPVPSRQGRVGKGKGGFSSEMIVPIFGSRSQAVLLPLCSDDPTRIIRDVTNPRQSRQFGVLGFSILRGERQAAIFLKSVAETNRITVTVIPVLIFRRDYFSVWTHTYRR